MTLSPLPWVRAPWFRWEGGQVVNRDGTVVEVDRTARLHTRLAQGWTVDRALRQVLREETGR